MKKIILSLMVMSLALASYAQNLPVKFGVKAGVAFPSMSISSGGNSINFDSKTSFYAGGTVDFSISNILSIQPGLLYINKGTKISGDLFDFESSSNSSSTLNLSYIEIPVNLVASFNAGAAGKVFIGAGPYYAFAIDANVKSNGIKEKIEIGSGADQLKRGDFGLNLMAGYQLNSGFNIHAGYGLGLGSVINEDDDVKFKNKVFSVGLGYSF